MDWIPEEMEDDEFGLELPDIKPQRKKPSLEELYNNAIPPKQKKYKSWSEIYDFFNILPTFDEKAENLREALKDQLHIFAEAMRDQSSYPNAEWFPLIEVIYTIYIRRHDLPKIPGWMNSLDDFDSFINYFFPEGIHKNSKSYIVKNIRRFCSMYIRMERIYEYRESFRNFDTGEFYNAGKRRWIALPPNWILPSEEDVLYVDVGIIEEVIEILKNNTVFQDGFVHASGSAALEGIAKANKLLSARKALQSGIEVKTGEFNYYISSHDETSVSGGPKGLGSLYASHGYYPYLGYTTSRWFNESAVVFLINKEKHIDSLKRKSIYLRKGIFDELEPVIRDYGGEGVLIGSEVELIDLDCIFCEKDYQDNLIQWCQQNAPHLKVISVEAMEFISTYLEEIQKLAHQRNLTILETLEYLKTLVLNRNEKEC